MPSYSLSILRHDDSSDFLTFSKSLVTIGREVGDIVTGDPLMSGQHAELRFENGSLVFNDLGSTNGSFQADGQKITSALRLGEGHALKLGGCKLIIQEIEGVAQPGATQVLEQVPPELAKTAYASEPPQASTPAPPNTAPAQAPSNAPIGSTPAPDAAPAPATAASGGNSTPPPAGGFASQVDELDEQIQRIAEQGPASEGLVDQLKYFLALGAGIYKENYVNGVLTMGLIAIPATLVDAALSPIPLLSLAVSILVALFQLLLTPISTGAMGRWALGTAAGEPLTWQQSWRAALKNPVGEWLNLAVASFVSVVGYFFLIVPGVLLSLFSLPAYLIENKRFIGINMRSFELVMKDAGRHLGLACLVLLVAIPVFIASGILGFVFGFIPVLGSVLSQVATMALFMFVTPYIYLVWSLIYFDARKRIDSVDARAEAATRARAWKS